MSKEWQKNVNPGTGYTSSCERDTSFATSAELMYGADLRKCTSRTEAHAQFPGFGPWQENRQK